MESVINMRLQLLDPVHVGRVVIIRHQSRQFLWWFSAIGEYSITSFRTQHRPGQELEEQRSIEPTVLLTPTMTKTLHQPQQLYHNAGRMQFKTTSLLLLLSASLQLFTTSDAFVLFPSSKLAGWSTSAATTTTTTHTASSSSRLSSATTPSSSLPALYMSTTATPPTEEGTVENESQNLPLLGPDGVYHILNQDQHKAFLEANPDKLIVLKIFAPWCRACKGLEPKYNAIVQDPKYDNLPLVFADLTVQHNKDFVKSIGVLALPTIQFYAGSEGLVDNFPCGPSKVPILKRKLARFINDRVDARTRTLKQPSGPSTTLDDESETMPVDESSSSQMAVVEADMAVENGDVDTDGSTKEPEPAAVAFRVGGLAVTEEQLQHLKNIPFFREFTEEEFTTLFAKAKVLSFEPGSIILREGMPGRMFYIIESGEVEICQKTVFADPLTTPPSYLGTVINRLSKGDYFGERALITGEPRAASIRASEKTRCFAFDVSDIPASTILSGKAGSATPQRLKQVNDKYGVALSQLSERQVERQILASQAASQFRGSVNSPKPIRGVDTDEEDDEIQVTIEQDDIYPLLKRFQLIRHVSRCFDYIMKERPNWGDVPGSSNRRSMLVKRLTASQRAEFHDVFNLIDESNDGVITVLELKRVMESIGDKKSDEELLEMITSSQGTVDGKKEITMEDFMGIMAEAELYHLFRDTFAALDQYNTGFVKAADLDRVLCGVRDLIADDRNSIIDVEDKDILIDYEQFSKMLLGVTLK